MASPKAAQRPIEIEFFRTLNRVVEPMVRAGIGSPRIAPSGFIVLETRGRKTGRLRRIPLAATRMGCHVFVATFRGNRSQWVQNLAAQPHTRFWLGGKPRDARAFVMHEGRRFRVPTWLPVPVQAIARFVAPYTKAGWAFAILSPRAGEARRLTRRCS
jgi:deazaflavin-dependent oxidoreductase (nitroreductase family)